MGDCGPQQAVLLQQVLSSAISKSLVGAESVCIFMTAPTPQDSGMAEEWCSMIFQS